MLVSFESQKLNPLCPFLSSWGYGQVAEDSETKAGLYAFCRGLVFGDAQRRRRGSPALSGLRGSRVPAGRAQPLRAEERIDNCSFE